MLDTDAAELFGVTASRLRRAVKRGPERFPSDCVYELTLEEMRSLPTRRHRARPLYAFTETVLLMLSSVLNTPQAIAASISIIRELFSFTLN